MNYDVSHLIDAMNILEMTKDEFIAQVIEPMKNNVLASGYTLYEAQCKLVGCDIIEAFKAA